MLRNRNILPNIAYFSYYRKKISSRYFNLTAYTVNFKHLNEIVWFLKVPSGHQSPTIKNLVRYDGFLCYLGSIRITLAMEKDKKAKIIMIKEIEFE